MSEPTTPQARRADLLIYGTVLALAVVGAVVAVGGAWGDDPVEEPPLEGSMDEAPPEPAPETLGPVPTLPTVPDLRAEPPPPRPAPDEEEDPRFATLGVEMRYLSRARDLLADQPADALSVLEQHRRAHPQGALREEREAFAIEALVATGARDAAERRYYDFMRSYPGSDFASRLETLMR